MNELSTSEELDAAFQEGEAVLFKHNTTCPISASAHQEMERFVSGDGGAPVYLIDILAHREVSDDVARRTGVEHQSPQVIVIRGGRPAWDAALFDVTAAAVREQVAGGARA